MEGAHGRADRCGKGAEDGKDRGLEIAIDDVSEGIASVRVRSAVYDEYVHLVRTQAGRKIVGMASCLRG
jgi:hypothetical protein